MTYCGEAHDIKGFSDSDLPDSKIDHEGPLLLSFILCTGVLFIGFSLESRV